MFFFFSSRRRHTRWNCDWSSDVCSSDLVVADDRDARDLRAQRRRLLGQPEAVGVLDAADQQLGADAKDLDRRSRSEERRVGKSVDFGGRRIIKIKKRSIEIVHSEREM